MMIITNHQRQKNARKLQLFCWKKEVPLGFSRSLKRLIKVFRTKRVKVSVSEYRSGEFMPACKEKVAELLLMLGL